MTVESWRGLVDSISELKARGEKKLINWAKARHEIDPAKVDSIRDRLLSLVDPIGWRCASYVTGNLAALYGNIFKVCQEIDPNTEEVVVEKTLGNLCNKGLLGFEERNEKRVFYQTPLGCTYISTLWKLVGKEIGRLPWEIDPAKLDSIRDKLLLVLGDSVEYECFQFVRGEFAALEGQILKACQEKNPNIAENEVTEALGKLCQAGLLELTITEKTQRRIFSITRPLGLDFDDALADLSYKIE